MGDIEKEIFVQVDGNNNVIGPVEKSICHTQGILHRTVAILVFNQSGQLLMQLRSQNRDLYPGLYTLSVTGHVDWTEDGPETYEQAAQREYQEELGKKPANPLIPQFIAKFNAPSHHIFPTVYYTNDKGPFHTKPDEVETVEFMDLEKVKQLVNQITPPSRMILEKLGLI